MRHEFADDISAIFSHPTEAPPLKVLIRLLRTVEGIGKLQSCEFLKSMCLTMTRFYAIYGT